MRKKTKLRNLISMLLMVLTLAVLISGEPGAQAAVLHDNGPMVNSPGTHPGGGDESIMRQMCWGYTAGFNNSHNYLFDLATLLPIILPLPPARPGRYHHLISTLSSKVRSHRPLLPPIFGYGTASPAGRGSVVWGDNTTNVLTSVAFTDIYIVLDTPGLADDSRRVQRVTINTDNLTLGPGTYWAEWSYDDYGTFMDRQYQPPIRIDNETTTGDAVQ